jgi:hypothetical protein
VVVELARREQVCGVWRLSGKGGLMTSAGCWEWVVRGVVGRVFR